MRVCHLVHHLANGGLEQQLCELVRFGSSDVEYTVCYLGRDDAMAHEIRTAGARVVDLSTDSRGPKSVIDVRLVVELVRFLRRHQFDVVHAHSPLYVQILGRIASRVAGVDHVVCTYHNKADNFHPVIRAMERYTRPLSSANVGVSKAVTDSYANAGSTATVSAAGLRTIYNGIDVERFEAAVEAADAEGLRDEHSLDDELVFLNVGRYAPQKAQSDLLDAMADVAEEIPDVHLFVVGWGPLESELRRKVSRLGMDDTVTVTGKVPEVEPYYAAADVFVLPSLYEGLSIVLLEAMSSGLPIVATDVPGIAGVVEDGRHGYLVPSESPDQLASMMVELRSASKREEFGQQSNRHVAKKFDIRRTSREYVSLYESLRA